LGAGEEGGLPTAPVEILFLDFGKHLIGETKFQKIALMAIPPSSPRRMSTFEMAKKTKSHLFGHDPVK
jgi:hypothetical protein